MLTTIYSFIKLFNLEKIIFLNVKKPKSWEDTGIVLCNQIWEDSCNSTGEGNESFILTYFYIKFRTFHLLKFTKLLIMWISYFY